MGQLEISSIMKDLDKPKKSSFRFIYIVGHGDLTRVWKAEYMKKKVIVAIKEQSKYSIIKNKLVDSIFDTRNLLIGLYSNHIVNLYCTFQDQKNIYTVMDYLENGDLRKIISSNILNERQIKFFAGNIILGLEYIHSKNIIHRDIKPENILMDDKGYLRITDFDIAVKYEPKKFYNSSGTLSYMAPERIKKNKNFSFNSDYYSLGIILYEFAIRKRPFSSEEIKSNNFIFDNPINITKDYINKLEHNKNNNIEFSENFCDLVNKLLEFDPNKRIGNKNLFEIKNHPFFSDFPWKKIYHKTTKAPFIPEKIKKNSNKKIHYEIFSELEDNIDTSNGNEGIGEKYQRMIKKEKENEKMQMIFKNFNIINHYSKENNTPQMYNQSFKFRTNNSNKNLLNNININKTKISEQISRNYSKKGKNYFEKNNPICLKDNLLKKEKSINTIDYQMNTSSKIYLPLISSPNKPNYEANLKLKSSKKKKVNIIKKLLDSNPENISVNLFQNYSTLNKTKESSALTKSYNLLEEDKKIKNIHKSLFNRNKLKYSNSKKLLLDSEKNRINLMMKNNNIENIYNLYGY